MARSPRSTSPQQAARALVEGNLVALPTETVYGLGALASSASAVRRIFAAKGRPADHPLIVHVRDPADLAAWSSNAPTTAMELAMHFWPGPLTLVVDRGPGVLDVVTGGQQTIALRSPAHPAFAQVLSELRSLGIESPGIAAPSANRFGQVSPTSAEHVQAELGDHLRAADLILDGGPSTIGVESTIVICGPDSVSVARSGAITAAQLNRVVPVVPLGTAVSTAGVATSEGVRVPGSLASHYAPTAQVTIVEAHELAQLIATIEDAEEAAGSSFGVVGLAEALACVAIPQEWVVLNAAEDQPAYAHRLYAALREADTLRLDRIVAVLPEDWGLGTAIRDRLTRAATP